MSFLFNINKAIQATSCLLQCEPTRQIGKKRLLALLYMADRDSLQEMGYPIIGGRLLAMKYGPIHSQILNLIDGNNPKWSVYFQNHCTKVDMIVNQEILELSRYEIKKLNKIMYSYMDFDDCDIINFTCNFGEYRKNYQNDIIREIMLEDVIDAVGRTKDKEIIVQKAIEDRYIDSIFKVV